MRRVCSAFISAIIAVGLAACGGGGNTAQTNPTPTPTPTPSALTVSPSSATVALTSQKAFSATSNGAPAVVTWSVNGVQGGNSTVGTIDTTGNFTGPSAFPSPNNVTITAALQSNSSLTGSASVTVVYPNDNHTSQTAPVKLGTSGGNSTDSTTSGQTITCCSGTLGSLIQRGGTFFILSNNHVLDKSDRGATNDPVTQPGLVDNNCNGGMLVANLSQAAALKPTNGSNGPSPSNVDAAIATIVSGAVDTSGTILDLGSAGPNSIAPAPPSATLAIPATVLANNEGVAKSGRSSGLTCSNLQSVNTTVSVQYDSSCGGAVAFTSTFSNQVIINGANFSASGDSGSLVVTSDTAQPVGLLYAGNSTSTSANPIQDVINAFTNGSGTPAIVGGGNHPVSCQPTATQSSADTMAGANSAQLSREERERAAAIKKKYVANLMANPAVAAVSVGASADNPQEAAISVTVQNPVEIPAVLDGVRTQIIYANSAAPRASVAEINRATAIKEAHVQSLMAQPGIQGLGIGVSDDDPAEAAIVIYVNTGIAHPAIPPTLDGLRTKIIEGDRFRAFGWGHETKPSACSAKQLQSKKAAIQKLP